MEAVLKEVKAIRSMLEFIIEYIVRVEEPEEWEKKLIEEALSDEILDEEEIWKTLGLKSREKP
ncbi:MAG: hypothetical protein DRJ32_07200 [Thermoprotei archaeon]|nr:MAG: hypothetical protein B6U94_08515 [Thermofilum sp. ex4484_79]RLE58077.1 MAG: hypothetical protein DRJ32_07200 [Thermoprotei archaeon]HDD63915.1 hypothetical protein [Thermoprotei archaeon]